MDRYQSHKVVAAAKIARYEPAVWQTNLTVSPHLISFTDPNMEPVAISEAMVAHHTPVAGDYYVVYEDGYPAISPGAVFEAGYSRIFEPGEAPVPTLADIYAKFAAAGANMLDAIVTLGGSRELALAKTNLQQAEFWFGQHGKATAG